MVGINMVKGLVVFIIALFPALVVGEPGTIYIENHCGPGGLFKFGTDFVLRYSDVRTIIPAAYSCIMPIQNQDTSKQVQVRFILLNTAGNQDCSAGAIVIQEGSTFLTPSHGVCGTTAPSKNYRTVGDKVTIVLTNRGRSSMYGDFKVLVTSIYNATSNSSSSSRCRGTDFKCDNGLCVSSQVICNGYDDCGDNTDENEGCALAVGVVIGIVIAVLFAVSIITSVLYCFGRRRRSYTRVTQVVREYPTVNEPAPAGKYVPSYFNNTTTSYQTL